MKHKGFSSQAADVTPDMERMAPQEHVLRLFHHRDVLYLSHRPWLTLRISLPNTLNNPLSCDPKILQIHACEIDERYGLLGLR